jgi:hypothetical protein
MGVGGKPPKGKGNHGDAEKTAYYLYYQAGHCINLRTQAFGPNKT